MTKGRRFMPSSAAEGNWFRHRGEPGDLEGRLRASTSTRQMLEAPFSAPAGPRTPPQPFTQKEPDIFQQKYPFTQHDNRHYFQDHGVYFGDGGKNRSLGRRLHPIDHRLHHTDTGFLHHRSRNPILHDYNPITATSYREPGQTEAPTKRRFPKIYKSPEIDELSTQTTTWRATPFKTPMHVLAISQEPFLKHNSWKYSHHGQARVYPPYNRKLTLPVPNILNRYGPDFTTVPVSPMTDGTSAE